MSPRERLNDPFPWARGRFFFRRWVELCIKEGREVSIDELAASLGSPIEYVEEKFTFYRQNWSCPVGSPLEGCPLLKKNRRTGP